MPGRSLFRRKSPCRAGMGKMWFILIAVGMAAMMLMIMSGCSRSPEAEMKEPPSPDAGDGTASEPPDTMSHEIDDSDEGSKTHAEPPGDEADLPGEAAEPPGDEEEPQPPPPAPDDFPVGDRPGDGGDDTATADLPMDTLASEYYLDAFLEDMEKANVAFNAPDSVMVLGSVSHIQLLLSAEETEEALRAEITESGPVESHQVDITQTMEAHLEGDGFEITSITPDTQAISLHKTVEWRWDVKAVKPGQQRLSLTLNAVVFYQNTQTRHTFKTFGKDIRIRVTVRQRVEGFVANNWKWLWTALIVPLAGYLWKRWKKTGHAVS